MLRTAAWVTFAAIVVVTLASPVYRPTTMLAHDLEHALAFLLLGLLFALAYPGHRVSVALAAVPVIGALEALQLWMPGRHARLEDFVVNLVALWIALAIANLGRAAAARNEATTL